VEPQSALACYVLARGEFSFSGPQAILNWGPFWKVHVMQISTIRARCILWTSFSILKHIPLFSIPSIKGTKTVTITVTKRQRWSYMTTLPLHIYWVPHWPRISEKWIQMFCSTHYRLRNNNLFSTQEKENVHRHSLMFCSTYYRLRNNNQFSTQEKENVHRHSLQSFAIILLCTVP